MSTLGDLIIRVGADISDFAKAMRDVTDKAEDMASQVEDRFASIGQVGMRLAEIGLEMSTAITLPLEELARRAIETAATFEQTQIAYRTFLGSAGEAQAMLSQLYNFAAQTPFQIPGILQGARTLLAMGFAAKDVQPVLRILGDTASGLGTGQAGLERMVFHLGQIRALGHINGIVLREMGQNGIAAAQMIASAIGVSVPQVTDMVTKKDPRLDSTTVINALLEGMNDRFGGAMKDQMETLAGQFTNFKDRIILTMVDIGNALLPVGKVILGWANEALDAIKNLADWFSKLPAPVQGAVIGLLAMLAAAGPLIAAFGGVLALLPSIAGGLGMIAGALGVSVAAVTGWALVIPVLVAGVVAAMAAAGTWIYNHWAGVKAFLERLWDGLGDIWNATGGKAFRMVQEISEVVIGATKPMWDAFSVAIVGAWNFIKDGVSSIWDWLKNNIFDPLVSWLEKIPGVASGVAKIASAGGAFKAADDKDQADKHDKSVREEAESTLHLGAHSFKLTDDKQAWEEKHQKQVEQYTQAVKALDEQFARHLVSAEEVAEAHRKLDQLLNTKYTPNTPVDKNKGKIDRNALDEISGELAAEEELLKIRRAAVNQQFKQSEPSNTLRRDDPEAAATVDLEAAAARRTALQAIAGEELADTLKAIDEKLKLYKTDQAGYEKLVQDKTKAMRKYVEEFQAAGFQEADVQKRVNGDIEREQERHRAETERAERAHQQALMQMAQTIAQQKLQAAQAEMQLEDQQAKFRLDLGEITKQQYLRIKQEEIDRAYQMELQALDNELDLLNQDYANERDAATTPDEQKAAKDKFDQKVLQTQGRRQQIEQRHDSETQGNQNAIKMDNYDQWFKPVESSFATGITAMIEGTKTFAQAFRQMGVQILGAWISNIAQMTARWITFKLFELTTHTATNQAKLASDQTYAGQSYIIEFGLFLKKQLLKAIEFIFHLGHNARKVASDTATNAVNVAQAGAAAAAKVAITVPINVAMAASYAAVAAAAALAANSWLPPPAPEAIAGATYATGMAFAGLAAFEQGGLVPATGLAMLHGGEMVLPAKLSQGIQGMMNLSGSLLQNPRILGVTSPATTAAIASIQTGGGPTQHGDTNHHWGGVTMHVHNSKADPLSPEKMFSAFQQAVRGRNLKMA